jgi:diacylglycerol kinase family enzyme
MEAERGPGIRRLLLYRTEAKRVDRDVVERLRRSLRGYEVMELRKHREFAPALAPRATVVVAGGDGSVSRVARELAGRSCRLGILPLGTFNNFASGLGIPADLDGALAVIRRGRTRPVTLGMANGRIFLEAAAIGAFGQAIAMGDEAKDLAFGQAGRRLREVAGARPFDWTVEGDFLAEGRGLSLVFANTPSTGAGMPISTTRPTESYLRLLLGVGRSRTDIVRRVLTSALLAEHEDEAGAAIRFRRLRITTRPRIAVFVDNRHAGTTPVEVRAMPGALRIFAP